MAAASRTTDDRTSRDAETREAEQREASWKPSSLLPIPLPQPGYSFRWIRTSSFGVSDNKNVSSRIREGWVPVRAEDHPELQIMSDTNSRFPGCVEVGGLLLCKTATENVTARTRYYEKRATDQMSTVDNNYLRENDPRMPLSKPERKSRTTFGSGE
jgi:hypothetical protein